MPSASRKPRASIYGGVLWERFRPLLCSTDRSFAARNTLPPKRLQTSRGNFPKLFSGVTVMIYKFLLLGKKRLKIAILANSEQEARQRLNLPRDKAAFIARIKVQYV